MVSVRCVLAFLLLAGCGTGSEGFLQPDERTDALLPVLEIVEVTPSGDGYLLRGRLTNPTASTWRLVGIRGLAVAGVQVPSRNGVGWVRDPDGFLCGTEFVEIDLAPHQVVETLTRQVSERHGVARLSLRVWQQGAFLDARGERVGWPDRFRLPIRSDPIDLAPQQTRR
jgi:hypothetical protein